MEPGEQPAGAPGRPGDRWQRGVVYQVYPRSFADSDGDGVGDLPGLLGRLDHVADLGVDAIWLSPIYPSPGLDLGYDVADHTAIDPRFGTMADLDALLAAAHARGIAVILDLVLNHTSDQHRWFVDSRASRAGEHADWYLWRDPAGRSRTGRPKPPNNWVSFFGGSAWAWEPRRGQFYLHTFLPEQPDLNWRAPAVRAAQLAVVRTWLERGVDGFRLDVFNTFFKHEALPSNPARRPAPRGWAWLRAWNRQVHLNDRDQPEQLELLAELRAIVDEQPGRMTVGELFDGSPAMAARYAAPRHLVFDFRLLEQPWRAGALADAIDEREAAFGPAGWPTVTLSNHDQPRHATRFARASDPARDAVAKAAATLLMTLRGTPFLYYGEELGLGDIRVGRRGIVDPPARRYWPLPLWWNRDGARAPMPWTDAPNGGFTTGRPWLPLAPDAPTRNVARQAADPASVLSTYRRLLALRRALPALGAGGFRWVARARGDVLAYRRDLGDEAVLVAINLGRRDAVIELEGPDARLAWEPRFSTVPGDGRAETIGWAATAGATVHLGPLEATIARASVSR